MQKLSLPVACNGHLRVRLRSAAAGLCALVHRRFAPMLISATPSGLELRFIIMNFGHRVLRGGELANVSAVSRAAAASSALMNASLSGMHGRTSLSNAGRWLVVYNIRC